ncbi:MAG: AAA family ATPase [Eubacteriales bacterium]|nr:AAA family ATPase [Eubacteriales bacterium]
MGVYLNPGNEPFQMAVNSKIYVDKTGLISYTNSVIKTEQRFLCVNRPRRFGKSMAANMLAAYYSKNADSEILFRNLEISKDPSFHQHLNKYNVIFLNIQDFLSRTHEITKMRTLIERAVLRDLLKAYPDIDYLDRNDLSGVLLDIYGETSDTFLFIIDEWDCIFREYQTDTNAQKFYLDFIRNLLKDRSYVALAYMTGILPIKKYGSHSALNMFDEFSMANPGPLSTFVGFTESEVKALCADYSMDFEEMKRWYDGYCFEGTTHIYSPKSVVSSLLTRTYDNFWNKTETFEALRDYIVLNYKGLKDMVIELLAGNRKRINVHTFSNDMTTFQSADDILTLLVHLGYLGYDFGTKEVFIPNSEIAAEFCNAVESAGWERVIQSIRESETLLQATLQKNGDAVARQLSEVHMETSLLTYNDENALSCTIALAYYSAREYYQAFRELPSGKGFADIVYIPRKNHFENPALVVELKWNHSVEGAISQIKQKKYVKSLEDYTGNLLLVGINYDKKKKEHQCMIEEYRKND